jgi:hypothetical protein
MSSCELVAMIVYSTCFMTHQKSPVPSDLLRSLHEPGVYLSKEHNIDGNRNLKGWKWESLQELDRRLTQHAISQGSELRPDYPNFQYDYLNPGVGEGFLWFERAGDQLTFHSGNYEDCPFMQAVAVGIEVIVPLSWSKGVEFVVTQRNIRRFHSATSVQLLDGTVRNYNPKTAEVDSELSIAA